MKIHRSYYEKQAELLYSNCDAKFNTNLELHTAFDALKQKEGSDVVIGSRMGSSVSDPEVELILSSILKKHGFDSNISSFNNFSTNITKKEIGGLKRILEALEICLESAQSEFVRGLEKESSKSEMLAQLEATLNQRMDKIGENKEMFKRYIQWKKKKDLLTNDMTIDELKSVTRDIFLDEAVKFSEENLKVSLKQNVMNLLSSGKTHDDRLRGGLVGLSSLPSKFDSKDSFKKERKTEINSEVMQLEIIASIMKDNSKRNQIKKALAEFASIVQSEDFNPKKTLKNLM